MEPHKAGYLDINGIQLYHEIYGDGKPVVLVHGGGSSIRLDFQEVINRLHHHFMLIGIDLQNHGKSDHREVSETFEQDAKDIAAVLDKLNIEKASFFGFSNGATSIMKIAELFPEKVYKIIAASGLYKRKGMVDGFFEGMQNATIEIMPSYLKENFLKLTPDENKLYNMFQKDSQRMINFEDWENKTLQNIKKPVFLIYGDRDVIKVSHAAELHTLFPDSRLLILPSGHGTYMMADEHGHTNNRTIDFTILKVKNFLQ
ncbi:alpha/beta fold hydrolase [Elizabethkingia anophelis]|uniref:Alpha/beta hydrolase n=1 Tax=Elizabethkingia anophelis TaxID=1117645 RepID=A0AAU8UP19_9FLAO|nr:alpha/beta hydrolase [Elizabethkingia anophelis]AQW95129.1 alpha/beta hydrolase [Elizabethkingia anophelis]AQX00039.1 alpha/beta hydrolase [Elizabethkingia anophelis]MCL1034351.1 alpha/beta hydrolase [Elizabethkingia anophelis]MCT3698633.1 alpha/beta hydrolase [Elizabethkingia anophelis]MCT4123905.1 alpha/beta hydrolase [Elizabethkingia anophelis]